MRRNRFSLFFSVAFLQFLLLAIAVGFQAALSNEYYLYVENGYGPLAQKLYSVFICLTAFLFLAAFFFFLWKEELLCIPIAVQAISLCTLLASRMYWLVRIVDVEALNKPSLLCLYWVVFGFSILFYLCSGRIKEKFGWIEKRGGQPLSKKGLCLVGVLVCAGLFFWLNARQLHNFNFNNIWPRLNPNPPSQTGDLYSTLYMTMLWGAALLLHGGMFFFFTGLGEKRTPRRHVAVLLTVFLLRSICGVFYVGDLAYFYSVFTSMVLTFPTVLLFHGSAHVLYTLFFRWYWTRRKNREGLVVPA